MQRLRVHRRVSTWVAALAILWISLAPTIAHAMQGKAGELWIEICSSFGSRIVSVADLDGQQPTPPSTLLHSLEHCPYCSLQFSASAPPPFAPVGLALLPLDFAVPRLFLAAPYTLYAWHHAPSHGPPSSA
jgi:hypothetical protein